MVRRIVEVESRPILFAPDTEPPLARRTWALVRGRAVDELTGRPPRGAVTVEADAAGMTPRTATDGLFGLVGRPAEVFPELNLQNYEVSLTIRVAGYIARRENVLVPQDVNFPAAFAPTNIGDLPLHREPIRLRGRTVLAAGNSTTPVAGATVEITGVWRTLPPANVVVPPESPLVVSLRPRAYFARPAGAGRLRRREMTLVAGEDKRLLAAAPPGGDRVRLSNRVNLVPGTVVALDPLDPERTEYLVVGSVEGATTDDQPATVVFTYPPVNWHPSDALVRRVTPQPPGADNQLTRAAAVGDACVYLDGMADLGAADVVEMTGGGPADEYHRLGRFTTTSDADGYYRLPPLSRVAQFEIRADDGAHPVITRTVAPAYATGEHRLDFVFS
ncbi:MAG: hypothetical protein ABW208_13595 [Pyrinomonadaceae bacterium]